MKMAAAPNIAGLEPWAYGRPSEWTRGKGVARAIGNTRLPLAARLFASFSLVAEETV